MPACCYELANLNKYVSATRSFQEQASVCASPLAKFVEGQSLASTQDQSINAGEFVHYFCVKGVPVRASSAFCHVLKGLNLVCAPLP